MSWLRAVIGWAGISLSTFLHSIPIMIVGVFGGYRWGNDLARHHWTHHIISLGGHSVKAHGMEKLDPEKPYILMTNHRSHLDVPSLMRVLDRRLYFLAKKELMYIPFFGLGMYALGTIIVDRGNGKKAKESLRRAGERIRNGQTVAIFPEGTRSPDGRTFQSFKKGGFHLAKEARVPILPAAVVGSQNCLPKNCILIRPKQIDIYFGDPIPVSGEESVEELRDKTREAIGALIHEAEGELVEET